MIKHHIKTAWRAISRNYFYTTVNILGLAVGLSAFVILINYVDFERGFDQFHKDKNQIYRVESTFADGKIITDDWATSTYGYGEAMKREFPEITEYIRINLFDSERNVKYNDIVYREENVAFADSNFFTFFSYPLINGDPKEVLSQPNTCVISETGAKKFFPNETPLGKILSITTLGQRYNCKVSGIFKDFPKQTNLHFDYLMSYATAPNWQKVSWYMHEAYTYVKVKSAANARSVEKKFPALAEKYKTEPALKNKTWGIKLVPLTDIHLNPAKPYEREGKGNRSLVSFMLVVAVVIVIIAWINYINIFTAKTMERAGEISIRKVSGATFGLLIRQFITESAIINIIALVLSLIMIRLLLPFIENMYGIEMTIYLFHNPLTWKILLIALCAGIILTGISPIYVLHNIRVSNVVKNNLSFRVGLGKKFREGLVVFQYVASIILIVATIIQFKQLIFMQNQQKGVNTEQTLVFKTPARSEDFGNKILAMMEELKALPGVAAVSSSSSIPGKEVAHYASNQRADDPSNQTNLFEMLRADYDFIPLYDLKLAAGRNFSKDHPTDKDGLIINETALKLFGFKNYEDALKGQIKLEGVSNKKYQVLGILKDYHHLSLKETYRPIVLLMANEHRWIANQFYAVKINSSHMQSMVNTVSGIFKLRFPESSFDYFFLDEYYNRQYKTDALNSKLIGLFSWLAIVIVCLGILSLSDFLLLKRTKEIGVRKVNGAKISQMLMMLNYDFIRLIAVAFIIACPIAWYAMHTWLKSFAYKTTLSWWVFAVAGLIAVAVALLTVSWQCWKTASRNPVEALRYE